MATQNCHEVTKFLQGNQPISKNKSNDDIIARGSLHIKQARSLSELKCILNCHRHKWFPVHLIAA